MKNVTPAEFAELMAENPLFRVARAVAEEIGIDDEDDDEDDTYEQHCGRETWAWRFA